MIRSIEQANRGRKATFFWNMASSSDFDESSGLNLAEYIARRRRDKPKGGSFHEAKSRCRFAGRHSRRLHFFPERSGNRRPRPPLGREQRPASRAGLERPLWREHRHGGALWRRASAKLLHGSPNDESEHSA